MNPKPFSALNHFTVPVAIPATPFDGGALPPWGKPGHVVSAPRAANGSKDARIEPKVQIARQRPPVGSWGGPPGAHPRQAQPRRPRGALGCGVGGGRHLPLPPGAPARRRVRDRYAATDSVGVTPRG